MKTKTKPSPRARRMWANYYPEIVCVHHTRKSAGASGDPSYPHAVPVAVIPLDDPLIVPALAALGIRLSKGGRK